MVWILVIVLLSATTFALPFNDTVANSAYQKNTNATSMVMKPSVNCCSAANSNNCVGYARCMTGGKLPGGLGTCAGKRSVGKLPRNAGREGCVLFRFNSCCSSFPCKDPQCPCHAEFIQGAIGSTYHLLQSNWVPGVCNTALLPKNDDAIFGVWCP